MAAAPSTAPPVSKPVRSFGRFELRKLLGKSARSMVWLVFDVRAQRELVLTMPRQQPGRELLEDWKHAAQKAARLEHPHLAPVVEVGEHDHWPYAVYERGNAVTLAERGSAQGEAAADVARWLSQALEGLAFAHEAGVAHHDIQPHMLLLGEQGQVRLMGLAVAMPGFAAEPGRGSSGSARNLVDTDQLRAQRHAAERDVLALGVVLQQLLAAQPVLGEPDVGMVIDRMPPLGRDIVRLPWTLPRPVAEPLRAIANRATDRQERQRYRNARTLSRALGGWLESESAQGGDPHAALLERVRQIGALPAAPGGAARATRLATLDRERTNELARLVLRDLALSFELLRAVNAGPARGSSLGAGGPVLTVRRAIAMLGVEGVRRASAGLRAWPGPMNEAAAQEMARLIDDVKQAGSVAQALRPAGYDPEVVYLVTLLQNLGRMVVQYHHPEEAVQIRRLMVNVPGSRAGEPDEPGMSEEAAAFAVLGIGIESIGAAVARHWGLDDAVLQMIRPLSPTAPVRSADNDDDMLRSVASAANEAVLAAALPGKAGTSALATVAQRYARVLNLSLRDLQTALQAVAEGQDTWGEGAAEIEDETEAAAATEPEPPQVSARG